MLVLSRKKNESVMIGDNITIVVIEIRGDKVRLGIDAPKDISVHRREVYDAIKANERKVEEDRCGQYPIRGMEPDTLPVDREDEDDDARIEVLEKTRIARESSGCGDSTATSAIQAIEIIRKREAEELRQSQEDSQYPYTYKKDGIPQNEND